MSYSHSFSEDFYMHEGDLVRSKRPTSVQQALFSLSVGAWNVLAQEVFQCKGKYLDIETVMSKIMETNTVSNLDSPVEVWIDEEGYQTIKVYDRRDDGKK